MWSDSFKTCRRKKAAAALVMSGGAVKLKP